MGRRSGYRACPLVVGRLLTALAVLRDVVRDGGNDDAGDSRHGDRLTRRVGVHSLHFRGLLRIHSRYGPYGCDHAFRAICPQGFDTPSYLAASPGWLPR